jgi:hypothetical protein
MPENILPTIFDFVYDLVVDCAAQENRLLAAAAF